MYWIEMYELDKGLMKRWEYLRDSVAVPTSKSGVPGGRKAGMVPEYGLAVGGVCYRINLLTSN